MSGVDYSCTWAKRKLDSGGDTPFLSVSHAAARPHTPFLSGVAVSISDTDLSVRMIVVRMLLEPAPVAEAAAAEEAAPAGEQGGE